MVISVRRIWMKQPLPLNRWAACPQGPQSESVLPLGKKMSRDGQLCPGQGISCRIEYLWLPRGLATHWPGHPAADTQAVGCPKFFTRSTTILHSFRLKRLAINQSILFLLPEPRFSFVSSSVNETQQACMIFQHFWQPDHIFADLARYFFTEHWNCMDIHANMDTRIGTGQPASLTGPLSHQWPYVGLELPGQLTKSLIFNSSAGKRGAELL